MFSCHQLFFQSVPCTMATGGSCRFDGQSQRNRKLLQDWKDKKPEVLDPSLALVIRTGPGLTRNMTLKDILTEYSKRPEVLRMLSGKVVSFPVREFRVMKPPKPDRQGEVKFKDGPATDISHYSVLMDLEDIKKKDISVYNRYMDVEVEVVTKNKIIKLLETSGLPAVVIRSAELPERSIRNLQQLGLLTKTKVKYWEADLVVAVAGEKLRIGLLEVKRKDEMPGDQTRRAMTIDQPSTRQAINKALKQLETNVEMIQVTPYL